MKKEIPTFICNVSEFLCPFPILIPCSNTCSIVCSIPIKTSLPSKPHGLICDFGNLYIFDRSTFDPFSLLIYHLIQYNVLYSKIFITILLPCTSITCIFSPFSINTPSDTASMRLPSTIYRTKAVSFLQSQSWVSRI